MTGAFEVSSTIGKQKTTPRSVELPEEVLNDLHRWWYAAKHGDEFKIRCELEV